MTLKKIVADDEEVGGGEMELYDYGGETKKTAHQRAKNGRGSAESRQTLSPALLPVLFIYSKGDISNVQYNQPIRSREKAKVTHHL